MESLDSVTRAGFLSRFYDLSDAVIRKIEHDYLSTGVQTTTVTIEAQDQLAAEGWSHLAIRVSGVRELVFKEGRTTCQILSSGVQIDWYDGLVFCDFSPYSTAPISIDDVVNPSSTSAENRIGAEQIRWWLV
jgi:hypothetical protein